MPRIVAFDIEYDPRASGTDLELALLAVFGFVQGGVQFRRPAADEELAEESPRSPRQSRSALTYLSGNYDQFEHRGCNLWVGDMVVYRTGNLANTTFDRRRGNRFEFGAESNIEKAKTSYLVHSADRVLLFMEHAEIPFTRLRSYVFHAQLILGELDQSYRFDLKVIPRQIDGGVRAMFDLFNEVRRVTVEYGHSRSPGVESKDLAIRSLRAARIRETAIAAVGGQLDKSVLLSGVSCAPSGSARALVPNRQTDPEAASPSLHNQPAFDDLTIPSIAGAIEHVDRNATNGSVEITGLLEDGEEATMNSGFPVQRVMVRPDGPTRREFIAAVFPVLGSRPGTRSP